MAVALEYVIGGLTAVCTSLTVVLLLWRLSRRCNIRATTPPPPCCDVTDVLAWLLDACQACTGAAILVLVVGDDATCAAAGFAAALGGAQTLWLLATRAVVMATGHVDRCGSRDFRCDVDGKSEEKRRRCVGCWWCFALLFVQISVVAVLCALPLSTHLPIAAATTRTRNHTAAHHITCLPLTSESRAAAAWRYSCFLAVAVGWLPALVAGSTDLFHYFRRKYKADVRRDCSCGDSAAVFSVGVVRLVFWTAVVALISAEVWTTSAADVAVLQLALVLLVDAAMLTHVLHHALSVRQRCVGPSHSQQQQQQRYRLPARLNVVTRAHRQLVRSPSERVGCNVPVNTLGSFADESFQSITCAGAPRALRG